MSNQSRIEDSEDEKSVIRKREQFVHELGAGACEYGNGADWMKNAHERFGFAEFEKKLKDTTTRIRLTADCFIGERAENARPSGGHLLSAFGTDVEVAALWAAILADEPIKVGGPGLKPYMVQFGERPAVYRGTLTVPGRRCQGFCVNISAG